MYTDKMTAAQSNYDNRKKRRLLKLIKSIHKITIEIDDEYWQLLDAYALHETTENAYMLGMSLKTQIGLRIALSKLNENLESIVESDELSTGYKLVEKELAKSDIEL